MNKYQAVIIGFGKAGKTLAVTLAKAGWRVALIEQSNAMYGCEFDSFLQKNIIGTIVET